MVESPTIKVDRRGLAPAPGAGGMVEPPSPMSHAKILARHATFAPRSEEEKAFGCPIPSPSGASAARAEGENEDPGRAGAAKAAAAASPRPAGRATVATSTPEKKKEAAASPRRKFSFPKMGFFTRGAKQRDAPSPAAPLRAAAATPPRRPKGSMLLEPRGAADQRVTLVLDLDETLVRSSFDTNFDADFEAPFNLNGSWCTARVRKRPFVDEFLTRVADKFEVVIMTAGVRPYASLVLDLLDTGRVLGPRFYRESCTKTANGLLVKDLSRMNRDLKRTIIVDNSPNAYLWHPEHAIDVVDFVGDPEDDELKTIADFLDVIHDVDDVRQHVAHWRSGGSYELPPNARADAPNRAALAKEAKAAGN